MANEVASSGSGLTENEKNLSALGYVCLCCIPMFLVPMLALKESRYAQFHARQAAVLYIFVAAGTILGWIAHTVLMVGSDQTGLPLYCLSSIFFILLGGAGLVFIVLGAVNAMQGKEAPLPVIGPFASKLPF